MGLLMNQGGRLNGRSWRRFRNCEGKPGIPTLGPVFGAKLKIGLHAQKALLASNRENVSQLRTDREHPRVERTEPIAGAAVTSNLVIGISNKANKELLGQELRCPPVQMEINAALILGGRV